MDTKELHKEAKQSSDEDIHLIAYKIWLDEGCPDGRHIEHWLKAESIWRSGHEITKQDEITSAGETAATRGKGKQKIKPASAATKPSRARPRTHPGPESR